LITIVSVATGTLSQQAIRSVPCSRPIDAAESLTYVPIAHTALINSTAFPIYNYRFINTSEGFNIGIDEQIGHDSKIMAAFIAGLSQNNSGSVTAGCLTGNCTFPGNNGIPYSTLSVSSTCIDITSRIRQAEVPTAENITAPDGGSVKVTMYQLPTNLSLSYCDGCSFDYQLGNGLNDITDTIVLPGQWSSMMNVSASGIGLMEYGEQKTGNLPSYISLEDDSVEFLRRTSSFSQVEVLIATNRSCQKVQSDSGTTSAPNPGNSDCGQTPLNVSYLPEGFGLMAAVCWLYPTVVNYQASVVNGHLLEKQVGNPTLMNTSNAGDDILDAAHNALPMFYKAEDPCYINNTLYDLRDPTKWPIQDMPAINLTDNISNETLIIPSQCLYGLGLQYMSGISNTIQQVFKTERCLPTLNFESIICPSWWLESLYNSRDASVRSIGDKMARGAKAVENYIRMSGGSFKGEPVVVPGIAMQVVVCTEISWPWLLFPAVIVLATTGLLAAMIIQGMFQHDAYPIWKSSQLPFLFYGLEYQERQQKLLGTEQLRQTAEGLQVRLQPGVDGWRLSTAGVSTASDARHLALRKLWSSELVS
jgi:hypothetical protein